MLKFTYTETGIHLEHLTTSLEELITQRIILTMRIGQTLMIEPGQASLLLPKHLPELATLEAIARQFHESITVSSCDAEFVEVTLPGTWLSTHTHCSEGIFLVDLEAHTEYLLVKLWKLSLDSLASFATG